MTDIIKNRRVKKNKTNKKNPGLKVRSIPVYDLIPYAKNSRVHTRANIKKIAASIREFGFNSPVLIDDKKGIIAGHGRVLAAELLGMQKIPAIELSHLSENQKKAYILADNKIAENSTWDTDLLLSELQFLSETDINIETLGFDDLKIIEEKEQKQRESDPDYEFNKFNNNNCEMPIVPDFFEKHSCFIIVVHNEIDENFVRSTLGLTENYKSRSKDKKIRKTNVIDVEALRKLWKK